MDILFNYFRLSDAFFSVNAKRSNIDNETIQSYKSYTPRMILNNVIDMVSDLDVIRSNFGHPLIITSGYRCSKLNKLVGGVDDSKHQYGNALDISLSYSAFKDKDWKEVQQYYLDLIEVIKNTFPTMKVLDHINYFYSSYIHIQK